MGNRTRRATDTICQIRKGSMSWKQRELEIVRRKGRKGNRDGKWSVVEQAEREDGRWGTAQPHDWQNRRPPLQKDSCPLGQFFYGSTLSEAQGSALPGSPCRGDLPISLHHLRHWSESISCNHRVFKNYHWARTIQSLPFRPSLLVTDMFFGSPTFLLQGTF